MAQDEDKVASALDHFGQHVIVWARDFVIDTHDQWVATAPGRESRPWAAVEVQQRDADDKAVAQLPAELQRLIRRVVVRSVDETIHWVLVGLDSHSAHNHEGEAEPNEKSGYAKLEYKGIELLSASLDEMAWNGIYWGTGTDEGWYARFSKFGESGNGGS